MKKIFIGGLNLLTKAKIKSLQGISDLTNQQVETAEEKKLLIQKLIYSLKLITT